MTEIKHTVCDQCGSDYPHPAKECIKEFGWIKRDDAHICQECQEKDEE